MRDFFRGVIRLLIVVGIVASCTETFYFMGELSKNQVNSYKKPKQYFYNKSSTLENYNDDYDDDECEEQQINRRNKYYY